MTMSLDKGPALIGDLQRDAMHLANNEKVSEEQVRRTMGRIGLLLCDVAQNAITNEEARSIAEEEAHRVAATRIEQHVIVCKGTTGSPTTFKGAAMIALSKSPWAVASVIIVTMICYHAPEALGKFLAH